MKLTSSQLRRIIKEEVQKVTQARKTSAPYPRGSYEEYMSGADAEARVKKYQYDSIVKGRPKFAMAVPFEVFSREYDARRAGVEGGGGSMSDAVESIFLDLLNDAI
jgi:hypothetical protein